MPRHFENIWVEAEKYSDGDVASIVSKLKLELDHLNEDSPEDQLTESFGLVLFLLTNLSKKFNVNVAAALQQAIDDYKIDSME